MKKLFLAAALICAGTFAPQTEVFGSSAQNVQMTLKGGPDIGVMEGWAFFTFPKNIILQVVLKDLSGSVVAVSSCGSDECRIDVSDFPKGLYYATITTRTGVFTLPFLL